MDRHRHNVPSVPRSRTKQQATHPFEPAPSGTLRGPPHRHGRAGADSPARRICMAAPPCPRVRPPGQGQHLGQLRSQRKSWRPGHTEPSQGAPAAMATGPRQGLAHSGVAAPLAGVGFTGRPGAGPLHRCASRGGPEGRRGRAGPQPRAPSTERSPVSGLLARPHRSRRPLHSPALWHRQGGSNPRN